MRRRNVKKIDPRTALVADILQTVLIEQHCRDATSLHRLIYTAMEGVFSV